MSETKFDVIEIEVEELENKTVPSGGVPIIPE
jgi:hypothetical protein